MIKTLVFLIFFSFLNCTNAQVITQAQWNSVGPIDPVYSTRRENITLTGNMFDSLVNLDRHGNIIPGQAKSWEISADKRAYTFTLRDDIVWSDGKPVVANDFVVGFRRYLDSSLDLAAKPSYLFENVKNANQVLSGELSIDQLGVWAKDEKRLVIDLISPASYFLSLLAYPGLVPVPTHILEQYGDDWWRKDPLVSNGPFVLTSRFDEGFTLSRNELFYSPVAHETIVIKYYKDQKNILQDFVAGKLDIAIDIRRKQLEWVKSIPDISLTEESIGGTTYGMFNTLLPKFQDPNVRRALTIAIDRKAMAKSLDYSEELAATTFTPPDIWLANKEDFPTWIKDDYDKRIIAAKELLNKAGYDENNPLEVTILVPKTSDYDRMATAVRSMWHSIGVKSSVEFIVDGPISPYLRNNQYEFSINLWFADYNDPLTFLGLLREKGSKNHSDWISKQYNELLDIAYKETDAAKRDVIYSKMETLILEENPITPLFYPSQIIMTSKKIDDHFSVLSLLLGRNIAVKSVH